MIEKLERVLELAATALLIWIKNNGENVPFIVAAPKEPGLPLEKKDRKPRATKAEMAARTEAPAAEPESPFGEPAVAAKPPQHKGALVSATAEETIEAYRRMRELLGVFIRRHAVMGTGQAKAKAIIQEVAPQEVGKRMEEFSYISNVQLAGRLEKEIEAFGAGVAA